MFKKTNKIFLYLSLVFIIILNLSCAKKSDRRNTLIIGIPTNPTNLDPRLSTDVASSQVNNLLFNKLVRLDKNLNITLDLAESYTMPDKKSYIFYLKKNVLFHNLKELTAHDVKYTFDTIRDPEFKSPKRGNLKDLEEIEILDKYTIKFKLKKVNASFLLNISLGIVPKDVAEIKKDKFSQSPIGTGPFKLVDFRPDERLEFVAFEEYFEGRAKLDRVIYKIIPDSNVRILELKNGDIDFIQNGFNLDLLPWLKKNKNLRVVSKPGLNYAYLGFNLKDPILKKKKVRQAIAYAIDRKAIVEHILKGEATLATGVLNPDNWAYEPEVKRYPYNIKLAKRLLDEAGYPVTKKGIRFTLIYKTSQDETRKRIGEILQEQLAKVGIRVKIKIYEWGTFYGDIKKGNFQIYTLSWVGVVEPDIYYYIFHSESIPPKGANRGRYINPELDRLIEKGRATLDIKKRKKIYSRIQKIVAEELPYISLWYTNNIAIMNRRIKGFYLHPSGNFRFLKDVYIE
jgi:peptide/nickel transport system substrate-binding protein